MKKARKIIGRNSIFQIVQDDATELTSVEQVIDSWRYCFCFKSSEYDSQGLRPVQLGALFSIKAHWTVSNEPATIVMPTGTGKTETMIATVVSEQIDRTLIIVCPICGRYELSFFEDRIPFNKNHLASYLAYHRYSNDNALEYRFNTMLSKEKCDEYKRDFESGKNTHGLPVHMDNDIVESWYDGTRWVADIGSLKATVNIMKWFISSFTRGYEFQNSVV